MCLALSLDRRLRRSRNVVAKREFSNLSIAVSNATLIGCAVGDIGRWFVLATLWVGLF